MKSAYISRSSPRAADKIGKLNGSPIDIKRRAFYSRRIVRRRIAHSIPPAGQPR